MDSFKHSFRRTTLENLSLAVYNTGYQKCDAHHTWGPATRDHYLIHFVSSGKGTLSVNNQSYSLSSGDMFIIHPSQLAFYAADSQDPWEYYWVGFNGTEAQRLINLSGYSRENTVLRLADADQLKVLLLNIYNVSGNSPAAETEMIGHLYLFLSRIIHVRGSNHLLFTLRDYLAQALRYIQYNYAQNIHVTDIATFVGISRSQLYRAFMAYFTISPNEFLQKYRVNEACSLLRNQSLTISEVSNSVGFSDPLYFSRVFKKRKGMSPTVYQAKMSEAEMLEQQQNVTPDKSQEIWQIDDVSALFE